MSTIYTTHEWRDLDGSDCYWYEYRLEENGIIKYKCHSHKKDDGSNEWDYEEKIENAWDLDDEDNEIPTWINHILIELKGISSMLEVCEENMLNGGTIEADTISYLSYRMSDVTEQIVNLIE